MTDVYMTVESEVNVLDDVTFLKLLDFKGKTLDETIDQLERLLACDRTELIVYRAELQRKLDELKSIRKDAETGC